jgi:hypothetical protein
LSLTCFHSLKQQRAIRHISSTIIGKMQSNTTFNIHIAKRCFYIACLNSYMFRPIYRPSSGCTLSYYKANYTIYSVSVFVHDISCTSIQLVFKIITGGPGSSVGIAIGYGLDGPGIESGGGRDFPHLSRPASLLYNGYRVFSGDRKRPGSDADPSPPSSAEV